MSTQTIQRRRGPILPETVVINSRTMEEGIILRGLDYNTVLGWVSYEVNTAHTIKIWRTEHIIVQ